MATDVTQEDCVCRTCYWFEICGDETFLPDSKKNVCTNTESNRTYVEVDDEACEKWKPRAS